MLSLVSAQPLAYIIALSIGIATAWWMWGRSPEVEEEVEELELNTEIEELEPDPEPEPAAAAAKTSAYKPNIIPAVGDPDDLQRIKGIGPQLEELCNSIGVTRFDQIARWTMPDILEVDAYLGSFRGRIARDNWVKQAKLLAAGDDEWHAKKFGP